MYRIRLYIVPEHEELPEVDALDGGGGGAKDPAEGKTAPASGLWWSGRAPSPQAPPPPPLQPLQDPEQLVTVTHRAAKAKVKVTFSEPLPLQPPTSTAQQPHNGDATPSPPPKPSSPPPPPPPPPPKPSSPPAPVLQLQPLMQMPAPPAQPAPPPPPPAVQLMAPIAPRSPPPMLPPLLEVPAESPAPAQQQQQQPQQPQQLPMTVVTLRDKRPKYKEFDLEQKIDLEIKMREGSTKLLAACRHQAQTLEAAKNLLTSNERMSAYMAELQRRKKDPPARPLGSQPCLARVSLSDLRMPLIWRDTDHFKNKGDYRRFAVFCLARIGTEIYDTTLLCPVDRSLTDLTFPDVLFFNNIPSDFEFKLEVYSHILQDDLSMASTPRKIKKTIHSSISRTVGKKLAASLKDELNTGKIGPHFELMATARLSLDEVHDSIHTHDLQVENLENRSHQLPLFGHFCCRLAAQPDCISQEVCSGDILILEGEDRGGQWSPVWAQLQAFRLDMWSKREHWEQGQDPLRSVTVDRNTLIQPNKSKEITISNLREGKEDPSIIRLKSTDEQQKWIRCLVQHTKDHFRWKHAAENVMEIQSPGSTRHSFTRQLRQGSLYDETPLIESVSSDYHRPTVQEIFGMTPSTSLSSCASSSSSPTFRERSYSSGGGNKGRVSATGTVRSHWPFTRNNQE